MLAATTIRVGFENERLLFADRVSVQTIMHHSSEPWESTFAFSVLG